MLNPNWKKYPFEKDLVLWRKLLDMIEGDFKYKPGTFFEDHEREISRLYDSYYRTKTGAPANPQRGIRQKFRILQEDKVFEDLAQEIDLAEKIHQEEWNVGQQFEESLDARLEREKNEYEAKKSSFSFGVKISKRHL